ncbi:pilin [Dyella japonica]|uniref:Type IV pilus assembly protein PilA n=1 Tax=Dyella japonica TaxID=231455 RepID=A0ABV2JXP1_9GAMM
MKNQKGFTLIELMIVVAIIAILAAIAIPQYQTYVIRSQVTRAIGEAGDMKVAVEDCLNAGATDWGTPASCVNTSTSSDLLSGGHPVVSGFTPPLTITATFGTGNTGHANTALSGGSVVWTRDTSGTWTCSSVAHGVSAKYAPASCQ